MRDVGKMRKMGASNGWDWMWELTRFVYLGDPIPTHTSLLLALKKKKMLLVGKRPRPSVMRRTTSISGDMSMDLEPHHEELLISHSHHQGTHGGLTVPDHTKTVSLIFPSTTNTNNHNPLHTAHAIHNTPHFLLTCALCNCRLPPARDIYMYRYLYIFCFFISS